MQTKIQNLLSFNTFHINSTCHHFIEISHRDELLNIPFDILQSAIVLGGGSNVLLLDDIYTPMIKMNIKGIEIINETDDEIHLKVGAGEDWSDLVDFCVEKEWYGIENMALIPGTVGAGPMQNIGAYGREVKDVIYNVHFFNKEKNDFDVLLNSECKFGYRDSIFKQELKNQIIITEVEYILSKKPTFHLEYGPLKEWKETQSHITAKSIAEKVKEIRRSKLPDPTTIGNGGSFFKNPFVIEDIFKTIQEKYADVPSFRQENKIKIPAAWLIEKSGWKGYRENDFGVHQHQALVLVNYGNASGKDILLLSERIIQSVWENFGIKLEREINVIPEIKLS